MYKVFLSKMNGSPASIEEKPTHITLQDEFLVALSFMRPAQFLVHVKSLAVGPKTNCQMCIDQGNFGIFTGTNLVVLIMVSELCLNLGEKRCNLPGRPLFCAEFMSNIM